MWLSVFMHGSLAHMWPYTCMCLSRILYRWCFLSGQNTQNTLAIIIRLFIMIVVDTSIDFEGYWNISRLRVPMKYMYCIFSSAVLAGLLTEYVDSITSRRTLCVETCETAVAVKENTRLVEDSVTLYRNTMARHVPLPAADDKTLLDASRKAMKDTVKYFLDRVFLDDKHDFVAELNVSLRNPAPFQKSMLSSGVYYIYPL